MRFVVALTVAIGCLGLAFAEDKKETKQGSVTDQEFVMKASSSGLAEVNLGTLAAERASSPEVKKYFRQLVEDHTQANKELLAIASKKNITVAQQMDKKHQDLSTKLVAQQGADFDRHFMSHMVKDHEEAVALFSAKAKDAQDEDLKAFAAKTLPKLKEHLRMAKEMNGKGRTEKGQSDTKEKSDKGQSDKEKSGKDQ